MIEIKVGILSHGVILLESHERVMITFLGYYLDSKMLNRSMRLLDSGI